MKKENYIYMMSCLFFLLAACSDKEKEDSENPEEIIPVESLEISLAGLHEEVSLSRAVSDYSVNKENIDPTFALNGREDWVLNVTLYKGNNPYIDGDAFFSMGSTINSWVPNTSIYFPNYTRQKVAARLYPDGWTDIATDQSAPGGSGLLGQDVLEQNGNNTIEVRPAHILSIPLRHAHSMLDFRLVDVDEDEIDKITVVAGGKEYIPYQVVTGTSPEFMVIVPVGIETPIVKVYTGGGAAYNQTTVDEIQTTVANGCYCFTLRGLELKLGEIAIAEWTTGQGILGEYTLEESYPTFRGPANTLATLYYDNGLEQSIIFNEQGEATEKPAGRKLLRVKTDFSDVTLDQPLILSTMTIDLTPYFGN